MPFDPPQSAETETPDGGKSFRWGKRTVPDTLERLRGCLIDVRLQGKTYYLWAHPRDGRPAFRLAGYNSQAMAEDGAAKIARRLQAKTRDCITCDKPFKSTGPGHRMCDDCRLNADDDGGDYRLGLR